MTLSFSTQINGKPNYFIEKIWDFLIEKEIRTHRELSQYQFNFFEQFGFHWDGQCIKHKPKLHTIREDKHNRWKAGMLVHPVIKNRTPDRFQFAPVFPCVSVQKVEIIYWNKCSDFPKVVIDDKEYFMYNKNEAYKLCELAIHDGFDSIEDFFKYFNKDFTGNIIHFTDLKY